MRRLLPWETAEADYDALFADKAQRVEDSLGELGAPAARRYPSPPLAYRARAEFRLWHQDDDSFYVMFDPAHPREPVRIDHFPVALPRIQEAMPALLDAIRSTPILRRKLFQVEFLATLYGDLLITLVYHRPLDDQWEAAARQLASTLRASIVGRSRRQKCVLGRDFVVEEIDVARRRYRYRQYEQAFVQPNARVNIDMLTWATEQSDSLGGDLLELYCGNGNFTLPMSRCFGQVIATELSKTATRAARENLIDNRIENVEVVRLSAEEVSAARAGRREFRRLAALPRPLSDYDLRSVFVDPPRAGLDDQTLACVREFDSILYISCNPQTLTANLRALRPSHEIRALALFDQFPYTEHLECGVLLRRSTSRDG